MDKTFQPSAIETRWYQEWETKGYFAPQGGEKAYSIMIPPPNVTGSLHMGHGFQEAIMDALDSLPSHVGLQHPVAGRH